MENIPGGQKADEIVSQNIRARGKHNEKHTELKTAAELGGTERPSGSE